MVDGQTRICYFFSMRLAASLHVVAKLIPIALMGFAAQGQTPKPTFEVASIKPPTPLGPLGMRADRKGGPGTTDPGMYTCGNCPVQWLVSEAYDLQPFEYAGPDWLQNTRFDFAAKVPAGATNDAFRIMLQNLLAERFQLVVHREKREMPVYELTVAKTGPRFRESMPNDAPEEDGPQGNLKRDKDGFPILTAGTTMAVVPGHARIRSDAQTMAWLARMLSGQLQSPVIDATGLKAKYDFVLSWSFDDKPPSASIAGDASAPAALEPYRPALIDALQSQLGLKVEQKKGRAEVLVIDHMEKAPTGN
jgi:uncharacterized protein (TIGR03435 family)